MIISRPEKGGEHLDLMFVGFFFLIFLCFNLKLVVFYSLTVEASVEQVTSWTVFELK